MILDGRQRRKFMAALCSPNEKEKWTAVLELGVYVSELAQTDLEGARNWMRRFMWQLNEESGGIGWGVAETMGEAMARHEGLAREFSAILASYLGREGNYLDFEPLLRGALWGLGRLARTRPEMLKTLRVVDDIAPFLDSPDALLRGFAVWALGSLGDPKVLSRIRNLLKDTAQISLFNGANLEIRSIRELAAEAENKLGP
jgi:hypothetical protein